MADGYLQIKRPLMNHVQRGNDEKAQGQRIR